MAKRQISKLAYEAMVAQHEALGQGRYYANSNHFWCVDGIHGCQTHSHRTHGILTVEVQTNLETNEKTYWVFEQD